MALLAIEGFDHYASVSGDMLNKTSFLRWTQATGGASLQPGRNNVGQCVEMALGPVVAVMQSARRTLYVGFAMRASSNFPSVYSPPCLSLRDTIAAQTQVAVVFNATSGIVYILRGDTQGPNTLLYQSSVGSFVGGVFSYVEVGACIDPTAGFVTVKIGGQTVASVSGVNTQMSPNSQADQLFFSAQLWQAARNSDLSVDDLYVCDDTVGPGTYPCNTFLGDTRVVTLSATSGVSSGWTPLAGQNWQEVSETIMDYDVSYNYSGTVGATDTFRFGALPSSVTAVVGVAVTGAYRTVAGAAHQVTQSIASGSSTASGTAVSLGSVYGYSTDLFVVDPSTSMTWTSASVSAAQASYTLSA